MSRIYRIFCGGAKGSEGVAAIETVLVLIPLLLLIMGLIDLGHAWFLRQTITNASREGARYGALYAPGNVQQADGTYKNYYRSSAEISSFVTSYLNSAGLNGSNATVTVTNKDTDGNEISRILDSNEITTAVTGTTLTVAVQYPKKWWVLGFLPGLESDSAIEAQTEMRNE